MRDELIVKLKNHTALIDDECFELACEISRLLNSNDESTKQDGRNLIIRLLDNWQYISESYRSVFADLISAAGFYPYLNQMGLLSCDLDDEIRIQESANFTRQFKALVIN